MYKRNPNVFEKILLVIGIAVVMVGYTFIHRMYTYSGSTLTWDLIISMLLWLISLVLIINLAVSENVKEELRIVAENQLAELKLIKEELQIMKGRKRK
ncbi:hypothetical protein KY312_02360 [Candidatus Woesearchaeota archaeon]|nr:hypothetical protein [Candidatus Woesearchaeota archaeon]